MKLEELSKAAKAKAMKKISIKKAALKKEAVFYFQKEFVSPRGGGLRVFMPEPQKGELSGVYSTAFNCILLAGGNSNTGGVANRWDFLIKRNCLIVYVAFLFSIRRISLISLLKICLFV